MGAMTDLSVVTNAGPAAEGRHRTCMELRSGFADVRKARIIIDRGQAIGWAMQEAQAGDTVVIAGMGERPHSPLDPEDAAGLNDGELCPKRGFAVRCRKCRCDWLRKKK